jgi:PPE family
MNFLVLPPEINSLRMFSGVGSEPMLVAAAAWDGLAEELGSAEDSFSSVTLGPVGGLVRRGRVRRRRRWRRRLLRMRGGWGRRRRGRRGLRVRRVVAGVFEAARSAMVYPLGRGGQSQCVGVVGGVEFVWAERAGDCGCGV